MKLFLIFVNEPRTRGISSQKNSLFRELRVCGWTLIKDLASRRQYFFTDGQGNSTLTSHYHNLTQLAEIDWECIQKSSFSKSGDDLDRQRRYQAEFLVHCEVPIQDIESLNVYSETSAAYVKSELKRKGIIDLRVNIKPQYFF